MKLIDIKVSALKLMHAGEIFADEQNIMASENGKQYNEMGDSINRAINIINTSDILPAKTMRVSAVATENKDFVRVNLTESKRSIESIYYENGNSIEVWQARLWLDDKTLILDGQKEGEYIITYKYAVDFITNNTPNNAEIDLPDKVALLIPYFVKSEVYEEDEPSASQNALQLFRDGINALKIAKPNPTQVKVVYKW
jgi:hypothetical protein